MQVTVSNPSLQ